MHFLNLSAGQFLALFLRHRGPSAGIAAPVVAAGRPGRADAGASRVFRAVRMRLLLRVAGDGVGAANVGVGSGLAHGLVPFVSEAARCFLPVGETGVCKRKGGFAGNRLHGAGALSRRRRKLGGSLFGGEKRGDAPRPPSGRVCGESPYARKDRHLFSRPESAAKRGWPHAVGALGRRGIRRNC